jgi:hypothetical protein
MKQCKCWTSHRVKAAASAFLKADQRKKESYFGMDRDVRKTLKSTEPPKFREHSGYRTFFSHCPSRQLKSFHKVNRFRKF